MENDYKIPGEGKKIAFLIEKNMPTDRMCDIMKDAAYLRENGNQVLVTRMNKNKKFQKEQLEAQGYTDFKDFYVEALK